MPAPTAAVLSERRMVAAGLRESLAAVDPAEADLMAAAVELLIRTCDGRFASMGCAWITECDELGWFRLDVDTLAAYRRRYGLHPVLAVVEALAGGRPCACLPELLAWLDRETVRLVLAAFVRAARGQRDVAVYAFGGDPFRLAGWVAETDLAADLDASTPPTVALLPMAAEL